MTSNDHANQHLSNTTNNEDIGTTGICKFICKFPYLVCYLILITGKIGHGLLGIFFFLACQYIPPVRRNHGKKCCSCAVIIYAIFCTTIFGILINLWSTGVLLGNWTKCPIRYYGICFSLELHSEDPNNSHVPDIVLKDVNNDHPKYLPGE